VDARCSFGADPAHRGHLHRRHRLRHRPGALDPLSGASTVQYDSVWSGQPTISATNIRRILLNAAGQGIIWSWDDTDPLVVSAGAGLALVNRGGSAAAILSVNMEWDEG
jgi:hypothetical protein